MRMSHRFFVAATAVFVLCLASWTSVSAQPSFELGAKVGLGFTKLTGDDTQSTEFFYMDLGEGWWVDGLITQDFGDMKLGFVGGVYGTVHIHKQFGVRLEALYFKKGGKGNNSGVLEIYDDTGTPVATVDVSGENTVSLDYFEFPLLGVVSFPIGTNGAFDVFAGPALAVQTKAEVEQEIKMCAGNDCETESETVDISDEIKSTDFVGVLGAGLTFNLQQVVIFGEVRWEYGFTKIDDSADQADIKNNAVAIIVGVGIPLAKSQ